MGDGRRTWRSLFGFMADHSHDPPATSTSTFAHSSTPTTSAPSSPSSPASTSTEHRRTEEAVRELYEQQRTRTRADSPSRAREDRDDRLGRRRRGARPDEEEMRRLDEEEDDEGEEEEKEEEEEEKPFRIEYSSFLSSPLSDEEVASLMSSSELKRSTHMSWLRQCWQHLPEHYAGLESSRPWLVYWALHSTYLLGNGREGCDERGRGGPGELRARQTISFLRHCQHEEGGFCGSPQQRAHLAPTYAAVLSLCLVAHLFPHLASESFASIDCPKMLQFLRRMKKQTGEFSVSDDGECDTRGAYTALVIASLLNLLNVAPDLLSNTGDWLQRCQTYEGGIGGEPGNEAHGGYTFCALAAALLSNSTEMLDLKSLLQWAVMRQTCVEGGFSGRTNKLVDGCYTFWVAALFPLLQCVSKDPIILPTCLVDARAVQRYVLLACQEHTGGLRDKPGKQPDLYHTCYCLSGLSLVQDMQMLHEGTQVVLPQVGNVQSLLLRINPVYNIPQEAVDFAISYFSSLSTFA